MPFPLLAHQALVLPLKAWRPEWFSGTALVVGSVAPDLEYLALQRPRTAGFAHSFAGQFLFCLPVTVAVVFYVGRARLGEALAPRLGLPMIARAATDVAGSQGLVKVVLSALAGSFSHIALDELTHRVAPAWFRGHGNFTWHRQVFDAAVVAQFVVTAVFAIAALLVLRDMVRRAEAPPPPRADGRLLLFAAALAGAVAGGLNARPAFKDPTMYFYAAHIYVWGYGLFHVACGVALAWLLVGGALAWRDARQPQPA